jgi:hypothetical protein
LSSLGSGKPALSDVRPQTRYQLRRNSASTVRPGAFFGRSPRRNCELPMLDISNAGTPWIEVARCPHHERASGEARFSPRLGLWQAQ